MSIDRCERCSMCIDTDEDPVVYRKEFNDACLCDMCYGSAAKARLQALSSYTNQELADELTRRVSVNRT